MSPKYENWGSIGWKPYNNNCGKYISVTNMPIIKGKYLDNG